MIQIFKMPGKVGLSEILKEWKKNIVKKLQKKYIAVEKVDNRMFWAYSNFRQDS